MLLQSNSRNQRSKGFKVKNIVQVTVLLVVAIWLIYRIKHSHDKKNGYTESDGNELGNGAGDIHLGRKAKAGSENVIVIGNHAESFGEISEAGGGQDDAFNQHSDKKEEAVPHKENVKTESQQEQQGSEDNDADSHMNGEKGAGNGRDEDRKEVIRLHSEKDNDNSVDENGNRDGRDDSLEANVFPKDDRVVETTSDNRKGTSSDEESFSNSTSKTETNENAALNSERLETGVELSDKAMPEAEGSSNSSLSVDQSNADALANDEFHKKAEVESEGSIDSDAEIHGRNEVGDVKTDVTSDEEHSSLSHHGEENDPMPTDNEVPERETVESQGDNTGAEKTEERDTGSDHKVTDTSNSTEDNNEIVMPTNMEAPKIEAVEPQDNSFLEAENTGSNSIEEARTDSGSDDELAKSSFTSEQNNVEIESHGDDASNAEVIAEDTHQEGNSDSRSNDEFTNSSFYSEDKNGDRPENSEATNVDAGESQGDKAIEAETNDNDSAEETKSETIANDEAANSSDSNEQKSSDSPNSVNPDGETVESRDDNVDRAGNSEPGDVKVAESQTVNVAEDKQNGNGSAEVIVTESTFNDEAENSSHNNELNSKGSLNSEPVESRGDGASEAKTISNNAHEDTKVESNPNAVTSSELGNNVVP